MKTVWNSPYVIVLIHTFCPYGMYGIGPYALRHSIHSELRMTPHVCIHMGVDVARMWNE